MAGFPADAPKGRVIKASGLADARGDLLVRPIAVPEPGQAGLRGVGELGGAKERRWKVGGGQGLHLGVLGQFDSAHSGAIRRKKAHTDLRPIMRRIRYWQLR